MCAGAILLALLGYASVIGADPPAGDASVTARRAELAELKRRLENTRREIERLRREGKQVESLLAQMERERVMTERYIRGLADQESALEQDISARRGVLQSRGAEIARLRSGLSTALVRYYKQERVTSAELLISAQSFGEIYARANYWGRTIRRLREQVAMLEDERTALNVDLSQVEVRKSDVLALRREREAEADRLRRDEAARRKQREQLSRDIARQEEQSRNLVASQQRIEQLIAEALRAESSKGAGLAPMRGRLPWPVRGRILKAFGTEVHPRYGTQVRHKGIVIGASEGTPIRAVAAGRVVFVGWLEGYGNTVIIDHGGGWFTLYAHASQTLVSDNANVAAGGEIARVGSTDSLEGPCLHFEIRHGSEALDPAAWFE